MRGTRELKAEILRAHQEVADGVQGARSRLESLQAEYRTAEVVRAPVGATATLIDRPTGRKPISRVSAEPKSLPFGHPYSEVELLERYVDFEVSIGSGARTTILDAISWAHKESGDVELGGWLFAQSRPRDVSRFLPIAYATVTALGTRDSVSLGDPIDGMVAARNAGIGEAWSLVGDWHAHPRHGSELPSHQDAKAWAGTMDYLGRSAYVALVVSPSASTGWTSPRFSAWVAGRHGVPSRPMVGRARIPWE